MRRTMSAALRRELGVKYDYVAKHDYNAHRVMRTIGIPF